MLCTNWYCRRYVSYHEIKAFMTRINKIMYKHWTAENIGIRSRATRQVKKKWSQLVGRNVQKVQSWHIKSCRYKTRILDLSTWDQNQTSIFLYGSSKTTVDIFSSIIFSFFFYCYLTLKLFLRFLGGCHFHKNVAHSLHMRSSNLTSFNLRNAQLLTSKLKQNWFKVMDNAHIYSHILSLHVIE